MTFPDPYHEQHWHECPHHLQSPYLDSHNLHQTSILICQNDSCPKPNVRMTFPDPYQEQHWHEFPHHLQSPHLDSHKPPPNLTYDVSKWSLGKAKCQDDTSRPLSWTTLAWMTQTSPMPLSGPTWPPPNLKCKMSKWSLCKAKCQDDISRPQSWTLQSPHMDPHNLHQTSHMICQNDTCAKPSVKMTFPHPNHELSKALMIVWHKIKWK